MNKNIKTNSFSWPVHDDICWIPVSNILCGINTFLPQSVVGRVYSVSTEEYNKIITSFSLKTIFIIILFDFALVFQEVFCFESDVDLEFLCVF